jgi:MFS family permease
MPRKGQLVILALCRISDFAQFAAFQTWCYYQLKSFQAAPNQQTLAWQTGFALSAYTASQCLTAILWGHFADLPVCGRKSVLLIGLIGIGFTFIPLGFARSYREVISYRVLAGALNSTVGPV